MKKLSKLLAVLFAIVLVLGSSVCAFADDYDFDDEYDYYSYNDYLYPENEYTIDKYDVDIVVNEDNTFNITENITANFLVPKHGIYRYIPVQNEVKRTDGSSVSMKARVENVISNMPVYNEYTESGNYVIQLGEEDVELTGLQNYKLSYTYKIPMDTVEGADELYYNFIGTGWDTTIDNVTFSIHMPKDFDASKIGFSTGSYGAEGTDIVKFKVKDNTISGKLTEQLNAYEGATIRLELEDGYFTFNAFAYYVRYVGMVGIPLIALIVIFILWSKYGKDKKIVDVVEFYPPEGMNCAEMAYWYNGSVVGTDTVPIVIELANEGYVDIEEFEEKKFLKNKNSFKFVNKKAYDGNDGIKKIFFNGMFGNGKYADALEEDLEDSFYVTVDRIVNKITENNRTQVFNKKSLKVRLIGWVIAIASAFFSMTIWANTNYGTTEDFKFLLIGMAVALVAFILAFFLRQRTDEGFELKQKINGFKLFLETAEKDRLEALVNEDPSYFYNILPYAYVLGVSDTWTKKFESIAIEPPRWYRSNYTMWDYMMFNHFMHSTMQTANKVCISKPQQSSGGSSGGGSFSGGGGFSGGGFGGGGGGSW